VIGDVPHGNHRDSQARARARVAAFHASERVLVYHVDHSVAVVERVAQVLDQLDLGRGFGRTAFFTLCWRRLSFDFIEERELRAGDVLDLLAEATRVIELAGRRNEGVFRFRHGFGEREKLSFRQLERPSYTVRDGLGDRRLLCENRNRK